MCEQNDKILKLQEELTECMKKEVGLMREVLANMHQEEVSLIMFDRHSWTQTMQDRFPLVQRLSSLRRSRLETTQSMETLLSDGKKMPLEKILPESQTESCEIFYLCDQILALIKRMNIQHSKNESLMKNYELYINSPAQFHRGIALSKEDPKRAKSKASVATYPHEEP